MSFWCSDTWIARNLLFHFVHLQVGNVIKFHQDWNGVQFTKNASCIRKFCALLHMGVRLHNTLCTSCWKDLDMPLKYWNGGSSHASGSLHFHGEGFPSPQIFNSQIKWFCVLTIKVLMYKLHLQLLPAHYFWSTDHYSATVRPQTKKGRLMAKNNCYFMSLLLLTKYKINNFFSLTMEKQSELVKRKTTFLQFHLVFFIGVTFPLILSRISPWIRFQYLITNFEKYSRYSLGRCVFISFSNVDYFFLLLFPWIYLHTNTILNTHSVVKTAKNLHQKESLLPSNSQ